MERDELRTTLVNHLETLRRNLQVVSMEVLKTKYKKPFDALRQDICKAATAYTRFLVFDGMRIKHNSILELFDALCSTDEVQRGKEYSDVFELAARKLGVAPEHCIVFDDVLPAIKSAKAARMLAGGIYDKYSADQRTEIERIADIYLLDFRQAPIPHKEV